MKHWCMMAALVAATSSVTSAAVVYDGTLTTSEYGPALATSAGGPLPGFGAGAELNALYAANDESTVSLGIAGNVRPDDRILVFLDTKAGGYNNGNFGRTGAPGGLANFNSSTTFDVGFAADYVLSIGTDGSKSNYYFDLTTLGGTVSNPLGSGTVYQGSAFASTSDSIGAAPANSDQTKGFEIALSKAALGLTGTSYQVFVVYTADSGYLSNQFLTRAASDEGNYEGNGTNFQAAAPNPITVAVPEPASMALIGGLGLIGLVRRRRSGK